MSDYILEMKNIRKEFLGGKIVANDDITLKIMNIRGTLIMKKTRLFS